ncbi:sulfite exporter TauE/SafE family protein [Halorussus caseinilyticus]|uniref:Probable membrane transporter protein n=1 Tax=Halorussus caseinilyticus TaxID=3034025 RepID=A0ABD5WNQ5_9EURY|nr:sulfite exporter TauE/SafE family protein [Halorussus sp. DT72]
MAAELFGIAATQLGLFVGFGLLVGILFGFFGMGGSFLVTPALLVMGYDSTTAVGSGLAFVFGTSVIAALRHRDHGQVDYKLGLLFIVGMTAGIEVGKEVVYYLQELGSADLVVSLSYIGLLSTVGLFMLRDARKDADADGDDESPVVRKLQSVRIPPMVSIKGGAEVSLWLTLAIAAFIGVLSGFLGVGGGFLLMPAMMYGLGVPAAVAVGTDVFQITASGAFGAFTYAKSGAVDLTIVLPLLAGSAMGARVGAAATALVDEDDITEYFAAMLLAGGAAVASKNLGNAYGVELLNQVSMALIFGSALLVSGAVVWASVRSLQDGETAATSSAD